MAADSEMGLVICQSRCRDLETLTSRAASKKHQEVKVNVSRELGSCITP